MESEQAITISPVPTPNEICFSVESKIAKMDNLEDYELIEIFDEYCYSHPSFDSSFGDSLSEYLDEHGELTYTQREALEHIITKFRMESKNGKK